MPSWKQELDGRMDPDISREIDVFELQMLLRREGKLDNKIFAETRLRRGIYGQRYDNGRRHDGIRTQRLDYPSGDLTKGTDTMWDAPGMQRIKVPYGGLTPEQMEGLADVSEEYADGVLHVTTRQDFQLHFVHIDDTPDLMRRLAAVGLTTREACGNVIRNVTACPLAGVCRTEAFDVTPYARACAAFLLGHPDAQDFGRKFKIAFSGCRHEACGLVAMHDMGALAVRRNEAGTEVPGFELYVGGGLGTVPHQAKLLHPFVPVDELLPITQAICRVFTRLGEKKNRNRARLKFLVAKLGIDEFRQLVNQEREQLPHDPRWNGLVRAALESGPESPHPGQSPVEEAPEGFEEWSQTNLYRQRQEGSAVATVTLPLGDVSARQMRKLADVARRYAGGNVRTTVEQNILFRWVSEHNLVQLYHDLKGIGLADPGAGTIVDVTACPGTDTCKLGIASSRGLAGVLRTELASRFHELDEAVKNLHIKISGCFNSCGQHHVADIGFYGNSRSFEGRKVPHFQVVLGGRWTENAGSYGLAIGAVPSKRIPEVVKRITDKYLRDRGHNETFQDFVQKTGKKELRDMIEDLMNVLPYSEEKSSYSDWNDPREFTLGDLGAGECAGEIVALGQFELAASERMVFEAQLALDAGRFPRADELAYRAMLEAAKGLVKIESPAVPEDPDTLVREFRSRYCDTELFYDTYARGKFAEYLFQRHAQSKQALTSDSARRLVEEAQLFIEAAHSCRDRRMEAQSAGGSLRTGM